MTNVEFQDLELCEQCGT